MVRVFNKSVKMLVLTLMSILVISATAAIYYSLEMTSTITTAANDVYFVLGPDNSTAGVTIFNDNRSATLDQLSAYPNMTMTYDDAIRVRNNHATTAYTIRLRPVSRSGNALYFVYINFTLQTSTKISLNYTSDGSTWTDPSTTDPFITIDANTEYAIVIQTMANATATSGQSAAIEIAIDVEP